ncbi:MAG: hypothetical protein U0236_18220 [Nitrospira sp.]
MSSTMRAVRRIWWWVDRVVLVSTLVLATSPTAFAEMLQSLQYTYL